MGAREHLFLFATPATLHKVIRRGNGAAQELLQLVALHLGGRAEGTQKLASLGAIRVVEVNGFQCDSLACTDGLGNFLRESFFFGSHALFSGKLGDTPHGSRKVGELFLPGYQTVG